MSEFVPLAVLALIDGTSFGTLVIPLWLMLSPDLRARRVLVYLGVVLVAYLALGLALLTGAVVLLDEMSAAAESKPAQIVALIAGGVLMILGITVEPWTIGGKERKAEKVARRRALRGPGRMERWRTKINSSEAATSALVLLALAAVAVEAVSMVPYLAAIGILATADVAPLTAGAVMSAYCLVMIAPALVALGLRVGLHKRITPTLARLEAWIAKNSREALAWLLLLVGLYVAVGAWQALGDSSQRGRLPSHRRALTSRTCPTTQSPVSDRHAEHASTRSGYAAPRMVVEPPDGATPCRGPWRGRCLLTPVADVSCGTGRRRLSGPA